jgi:hypothetical protein
MEQLIALVAEKAGIDQEQAKSAVTTVMGFLKQKLPAGMAGQLDKLASGDGGEEGEGDAMDTIKKGLGGLFGK